MLSNLGVWMEENSETKGTSMALDWRTRLADLHSRLKTTLNQNVERDHYYHAVLSFADDPPQEVDQVIPSIYASGWRVAKRYAVRQESGVYHLHFIFDDNQDESDHRIVDLLRIEVQGVQGTLAQIPKTIAPPIAMPPLSDGRIENMLHWLYLLHWIGAHPTTTLCRTEIEFLESAEDYLPHSRFRPWNECSTISDFEPIPLLTLTANEQNTHKSWKSEHESAGRILPEIIASSLKKPLLLASVHAVEWLLNRALPQTKSNQRRRKIDSDGGVTSFTDNESRLLGALMKHHRCGTGDPHFKPMNQEMMRKEAGFDHQGTVSKTLRLLMNRTSRYRGATGMNSYKALCKDHIIDKVLEFIDNPRQASEFLSDTMDQLGKLDSQLKRAQEET